MTGQQRRTVGAFLEEAAAEQRRDALARELVDQARRGRDAIYYGPDPAEAAEVFEHARAEGAEELVISNGSVRRCLEHRDGVGRIRFRTREDERPLHGVTADLVLVDLDRRILSEDADLAVMAAVGKTEIRYSDELVPETSADPAGIGAAIATTAENLRGLWDQSATSPLEDLQNAARAAADAGISDHPLDKRLIGLASYLDPHLQQRLLKLTEAEARGVLVADLEHRLRRAEDLAGERGRHLQIRDRQLDDLRARLRIFEHALEEAAHDAHLTGNGWVRLTRTSEATEHEYERIDPTRVLLVEDQAETCPDPECLGPILDRPESDTWECTVCGREGSRPPG